MKRVNTAPLSGMQELLPEKQAIFEQLKRKIEEIYKKHGFWKIETPTIERKEVLLAKAGGETEKQIYFVQKTDGAGESEEALRFDHTVPLSRYVVEHANDLAFPFKVTQVGRNFRGERAQKGRFREFYQCDVDVVGRGELSISCDAEIIAVLARALEGFGLKNLVVRVNNRKILSGFLGILGVSQYGAAILAVIDKSEKVPREVTVESLAKIGLEKGKIEEILRFMEIRGGKDEVMRGFEEILRKIGVDFEGTENEENGYVELLKTGIDELLTVLGLLEGQKLPILVRADMLIVRGLDYYTGTVFEVFKEDERGLGSLCSGGRYENLTGYFTEQKYPGVGGSIGLTRLFSVLDAKGLLQTQVTEDERLAIIPISEAEVGFALELAERKRAEGAIVDVVMLEKKMGDKLKYAAKIAKKAIIIGENEVKSGKFEVRELN